jgi:hypothetical protein
MMDLQTGMFDWELLELKIPSQGQRKKNGTS